MSAIELKEILINARQESHRMRHYYIGVEHLFTALLDIQGGLTRSILEEQGLTPDYVADAIRRKIGKGSQRRLWAGTPSTPRASVIVDIATDLAIEDGRSEVNERDLLTAIIEENDNLPMRIIKSLGVNTTHMHRMAHTRAFSRSSQQPYVTIDFGPEFDQSIALSDEHLLILRRMFASYVRIRIDRQLSDGYGSAIVLIATPIRADNREEAPVAVKIAPTDNILDEAQRYETQVKQILPPQSARLDNRPVAPEVSSFAGLAYTLLTKPGQIPQDLHTAINDFGADRLGPWLHQQLFGQFGRTWWNQRRPFRFQVWTEYDWILPPVLIMSHLSEEPVNDSEHYLRTPVNRARLNQIHANDIVTLENFTVQRVDADNGQLTLVTGRGNEATRRASQVEITAVDLGAALHYRGEVVERITGRVQHTRDEILRNNVEALLPPFDLDGPDIILNDTLSLPNPLVTYEELLYLQINGSVSKIHGNLHLGNILIGPGESAFLIDFEHVRDGHTLFDWASLEVSLWTDLVLPQTGSGWTDLYNLLNYASAINTRKSLPQEDGDLAQACTPIVALRGIVKSSLARPNNWVEYYVALALCALRAVCRDNLDDGSRRLMFLLSALAIAQLDDFPPRRNGESGEVTTYPQD